MKNKKYEFTGETKIFRGITLHRIRAIDDIYNNGRLIAKKGDVGGWIEKEENLSHDEACWVYGNAIVSCDARVYGNAEVYGNADVSGYAWVYGNAEVSDNARVFGDARVFGNAEVSGGAWVYGNARVYGNAEVSDNARVYKPEQCLTIGPIGSRNGYTTFF